MDRDGADASNDPGNYLGNAVNSFRLARRLAVDWQQAVNEDVRTDDRKGERLVERVTSVVGLQS
jgi:Prolyl 4-Hydroxylase alpha-subunit, N-terminal region